MFVSQLARAVFCKGGLAIDVANEGESVKAKSNHDVHIDTGDLI